MVPGRINPQALVADAALLEQLVADGEAIVETVGRFVEGLHALRAPAVPIAAAPLAAVPAGPVVWDTSADALAQYDGAQLTALRAEHASVEHEPAGCLVCKVLETRLGSARP